MNISIDNGDSNGDHCCVNSSIGYVTNNHDFIDYTKKIYEISTNRYFRGNNGLPDDIEIDDILTS